ncbi:MAG: hypothetical protein II411_01115 [Lachnospiraceae bacterium]|nr:hypothetical protein [Lachnospiraceae bacterium]
MGKEEKKKLNLKVFLPAVIVVVVALAVLAVFAYMRYYKRVKLPSNVRPVQNIEEINEELNLKIEAPVDASDITYGIENDTVAIVQYRKKGYEGKEMTFVMRSASAIEDDISGLSVEFKGTPILMTVICDDGSEVNVEAYVAADDKRVMRYMKATWYDNDKYYSMVTEDLVTREDFLQEVNRIIIANHIDF